MALVPCSLKTLGRPHYHLQMIYFVRNRSFGHMLPAKIQISLCIHAVWSNSSPGTFWLGMDRVSICEQGKVWPDYANAQAILTLRWAHEFICTFFCCFFLEITAQMMINADVICKQRNPSTSSFVWLYKIHNFTFQDLSLFFHDCFISPQMNEIITK